MSISLEDRPRKVLTVASELPDFCLGSFLASVSIESYR